MSLLRTEYETTRVNGVLNRLSDQESRDRHRRMMALIARRIAILVARIHGRPWR
jgi:hypothetical protein